MRSNGWIIAQAYVRQWTNLLSKSVGLSRRGLGLIAALTLLSAGGWNVAVHRIVFAAVDPVLGGGIDTASAIRMTESVILSGASLFGAAAVLVVTVLPLAGPLEIAITLAGVRRRQVSLVTDGIAMMASIAGGVALGYCGLISGVYASRAEFANPASAIYTALVVAAVPAFGITLWRLGAMLAERVFRGSRGTSAVFGPIFSVIPIALIFADLTRATMTNTPMWLADWGTGSPLSDTGYAALIGRSLVIILATGSLYLLVRLATPTVSTVTGSVGVGLRRRHAAHIVRSSVKNHLRVEARLWIRHPVVVSNVLVLVLLGLGVALLPEAARTGLGVGACIVLSCLSTMIVETAYGRTRTIHWMAKSITRRRSSWMATKLIWAGTHTLVLASLMVVLVLGPLPDAGTFGALLCVVAYSFSASWLCGIVVPYSDAAPGSAWITTATSTAVTGLLVYVSEQAGLFDRPVLLLAAAAASVAVSVSVGTIIAGSRDSIRT